MSLHKVMGVRRFDVEGNFKIKTKVPRTRNPGFFIDTKQGESTALLVKLGDPKGSSYYS